MRCKNFWDVFSWRVEFKSKNEFMGAESFCIRICRCQKICQRQLWILFRSDISNCSSLVPNNIPMWNGILSICNYKDKIPRQTECWTWYASSILQLKSWPKVINTVLFCVLFCILLHKSNGRIFIKSL